MKSLWMVAMIAGFMLVACNEETRLQPASTSAENTTDENFFPVTRYLKGQIAGLKQSGINPQVITTIANRQDTSWLKIEGFENAFQEFLHPEIDSTNFKNLFTETRFADQTLDTYTFTYDPNGKLPATMPLQHWDVYINPNTNIVQRIYIVKKTTDGKTLQLTWQSDEFSKLVYLGINDKGEQFVEKEVLTKWKFE